ncbi:MAG: hypothetical protein A6F70_06285 [Cycloclasticus sp. symbiont of Bathymodiolus heckerae]|nr:MAG: hypothetical protein A6F70_06285 [Cycloclasticus sp. symbiont of Bathymodiolus heckerae]
MQIKDLCTSCDCWTITTIENDSTTATFTCTHCKNSFEMPWNTETRTIIRSIRHSLKKRTKKYPELQELKFAGDFVKLEERPDPKPGTGCK